MISVDSATAMPTGCFIRQAALLVAPLPRTGSRRVARIGDIGLEWELKADVPAAQAKFLALPSARFRSLF